MRINGFLHLGAQFHPRPRGVMNATIKTPYVACTSARKNSRLHRPQEAFAHTDQGKRLLAARFLCGEASADVQPVADHETLPPCERCEELAQGFPRWRVYAYMDKAGDILYIGQTCNLTMRRRWHSRNSPWHAEVAAFAILSHHESRLAAISAEAKAIRSLHPLHNIRHNRKATA